MNNLLRFVSANVCCCFVLSNLHQHLSTYMTSG